jgi:hypothetical protein
MQAYGRGVICRGQACLKLRFGLPVQTVSLTGISTVTYTDSSTLREGTFGVRNPLSADHVGKRAVSSAG